MSSTKSEKVQTSIHLFRFPPSKETTELLHYFAKVHQFDDRKTFKEEWNKWILCDEIKTQFDKEYQIFQLILLKVI